MGLKAFVSNVMGFFGLDGEKKDDKQLASENEVLKLKLAEVEEKFNLAIAADSKKAEEIKVKYEATLKEAKEQIELLDKQLKSALEGKFDGAILDQIAETAKLKKKIKDLEDRKSVV